MLAVIGLSLGFSLDQIAYCWRDEIWLVNEDGTGAKRVGSNALPSDPIAWSPDGKHLVYVAERDDRSDLMLCRIVDGAQRNLTEKLPGGGRFPSFSPDGTQVAFINEGEARGLYTVSASGTMLRHITAKGSAVFPPRWSKDGKSVVVRDGQGPRAEILIVSLPERQTRLLSPGYDAYRLQDDEWLILGLGGKGENLTVVDAARMHRWRFPFEVESPICFVKSPRRNQLAVGDGNELVIFELLPPGNPHRFDFPGRVTWLSWSSDGDRLAVSVEAGDPEVWVVEWNSRLKQKVGVGRFATFRPKPS